MKPLHVLAFAAIYLFTVHAQEDEVGRIEVLNLCERRVKVVNTPVKGGGYNTEYGVLDTNDSYGQQYQKLLNNGTWTLHVATTANSTVAFEYCYVDDGKVVFSVEGPWSGWSITSNEPRCRPDAFLSLHRRQTCPQSADLTLALCPSRHAASSSSSIASTSSLPSGFPYDSSVLAQRSLSPPSATKSYSSTVITTKRMATTTSTVTVTRTSPALIEDTLDIVAKFNIVNKIAPSRKASVATQLNTH